MTRKKHRLENKPQIKKSKRKFAWKRVMKKSGAGDHKILLSLRHHGIKGTCAMIYFSRRLRTLYKDYQYLELYFAPGYLGLKLLRVRSANSYLISQQDAGRDKMIAKILRKVKPREYQEEDLEFDYDNKVIVVPIHLLQKIEERDLDFRFNQVPKMLGKRGG